jgi:CheY-like chemotaxis protein
VSEAGAILCVDDEAIIILSLKMELLGQFGKEFIIETACDAEEALKVIDELTESGVRLILVISDWLMPGMKGDEFLAKVKLLQPGVRCIILSGQANPAAIERARREVSLDAYIEKPWDRRVLMEAVRACVDGADRARGPGSP